MAWVARTQADAVEASPQSTAAPALSGELSLGGEGRGGETGPTQRLLPLLTRTPTGGREGSAGLRQTSRLDSSSAWSPTGPHSSAVGWRAEAASEGEQRPLSDRRRSVSGLHPSWRGGGAVAQDRAALEVWGLGSGVPESQLLCGFCQSPRGHCPSHVCDHGAC